MGKAPPSDIGWGEGGCGLYGEQNVCCLCLESNFRILSPVLLRLLTIATACGKGKGHLTTSHEGPEGQ